MFSTLKNLKEKYENSSTWGEFFASYLIDLESIYKKLEGKTEKQQIEILKKALEDQTKKTKELIGEVAKQKEQIEELENSLKKKDLEIEELKKEQGNINLQSLRQAVKGLTDTAERSKKTFTNLETKIELIKKY